MSFLISNTEKSPYSIGRVTTSVPHLINFNTNYRRTIIYLPIQLQRDPDKAPPQQTPVHQNRQSPSHPTKHHSSPIHPPNNENAPNPPRNLCSKPNPSNHNPAKASTHHLLHQPPQPNPTSPARARTSRFSQRRFTCIHHSTKVFRIHRPVPHNSVHASDSRSAQYITQAR